MSARSRCPDCQHKRGPRVTTEKKAPCSCICHAVKQQVVGDDAWEEDLGEANATSAWAIDDAE